MPFEQVAFNDVQHLLHLAEDKATVLRKRPASRFIRIEEFTLPRLCRDARAQPDTAVVKELSESLNRELTVKRATHAGGTHFKANNFGAW